MFTNVTVFATVLRDGYSSQITINSTFDSGRDMKAQAEEMLNNWISTKEKVRGQKYTGVVDDVFVNH